MPIRTGLPHAAAALLSLLLSVTAAAYVERHALVAAITRRTGALVATTIGEAVGAVFSGPLVVTASLSLRWGVAWHVRHSDGQQPRETTTIRSDGTHRAHRTT
ncbi:hypothetical protein [Haloarcula amylolytica]|uniref:hypothetical protein n=1 Tax=Haloarcula amylolytica TaxID=396317 RepID=UPI003C72D129